MHLNVLISLSWLYTRHMEHMELTLCYHLNRLPKSTPRLPINTMRMSHSHHLGPGMMHFRMNHKASLVNHGLISALDDIAMAIDEDKVRCPDKGKVHSEGVEPEMVWQNWVYDC